MRHHFNLNQQTNQLLITGSGGSEDEESSEEEEYSSDEEEDENAALLTPALDSQILRTIAAIQTKDPSVYDTTKAFFDKGELNAAQKEFLKKKQAEAKKEGKKYTLKDYEREVLLEHGGYIEEEEEQQHAPKTHYQEQRDLKNEFMNAAREVDSDEEEEEGLGGGLLEKRVKTEEEEKAEDEAYRKFMLQNIAVSVVYIFLFGSEINVCNRRTKPLRKHSRTGTRITKKTQMSPRKMPF